MLKMDSPRVQAEWEESTRLEKEKEKLSAEFEAKKTEIFTQVAMARERLDEMASNTFKNVEAELPEKLDRVAKEQEALYLEALSEIEKLRQSLQALSIDEIVERSFLVVSGLGDEGRLKL